MVQLVGAEQNLRVLSQRDWDCTLASSILYSVFAEGAMNAVQKPLTAPSQCYWIKREASSLEEGRRDVCL